MEEVQKLTFYHYDRKNANITFAIFYVELPLPLS